MSTLQRLQALSKAAPVLNQEAANRATEAQRIQAKQATAPVASLRQAQAVAPQVQQAMAQPQLAAAQQAQAQQAALGQQALQVQGQQAQTAQQLSGIAQAETLAGEGRSAQAAVQQADLAQQAAQTQAELAQTARTSQFARETDKSVNFLTRKQQSDIAKLGRDVKQQLVDARMEFDRDEAGRKFANEIQVLDYARATAESEEALRDRVQVIQQTAERRDQLMAVAFAKVEADLQRQLAAALQAGDQERARYLAERNRELEQQKADAASKSNLMSSVFGAAVAGGMAGAPGGPGGIAAGAAIGAGTVLAANQFS